MKTILLIMLAGVMTACGHATTKMDRELALKLVDKAGRIEIVRTNNGTAPQYAAPIDQVASEAEPMEVADTRTACMNSPVYTVQGQFSHYVKRCFGGR